MLTHFKPQPPHSFYFGFGISLKHKCWLYFTSFQTVHLTVIQSLPWPDTPKRSMEAVPGLNLNYKIWGGGAQKGLFQSEQYTAAFLLLFHPASKAHTQYWGEISQQSSQGSVPNGNHAGQKRNSRMQRLCLYLLWPKFPLWPPHLKVKEGRMSQCCLIMQLQKT